MWLLRPQQTWEHCVLLTPLVGGGVIQAVGTVPSRGSRRSNFSTPGVGRCAVGRHFGRAWDLLERPDDEPA